MTTKGESCSPYVVKECVAVSACCVTLCSSVHFFLSALLGSAGGSSSVCVNMNPDGTGTILEGSPDIGGSRASMQMMAAEVLQIDPSNLQPVVGDTESLP